MEQKKLIGSGTCPFCGGDNRVEATDRELTGINRWVNNEGPIQNVMPFLSVGKREILMTGICLSCQNKIGNPSDIYYPYEEEEFGPIDELSEGSVDNDDDLPF